MFKKNLWSIFNLLLVTFFLRLFLLPLPSFPIDMNDWIAWANHILRVGPGQFYATIWSDYLPGYLYVLWLLAALHQLFPWVPYEILLKLPAVVADIALGWLIYKIIRAVKTPRFALLRSKNFARSLLVASLFLFNPFTFFLSSIWGQIDSFFSLILFLSVYLLIKKKELLTFIFLGVAFLIKPQTILFLPLMLFYCHSYFKQNLSRDIFCAAIFIATIFVFSYPFFPDDPIFGLPKLIFKSTSTYPYTSVFAMNFWGIFGAWKLDSGLFLNLAYKNWGLVFLGLVTILIFILARRQKKTIANTYLFASLLVLSYFMLPTRVHERWLYPFFPLFLVAVANSKKKFLWFLFLAFSVLHFVNLYYVYTYYQLYVSPRFFQIDWLMKFIEKNFSLLSLASFLLYGGLIIYAVKLRIDEKA